MQRRIRLFQLLLIFIWFYYQFTRQSLPSIASLPKADRNHRVWSLLHYFHHFPVQFQCSSVAFTSAAIYRSHCSWFSRPKRCKIRAISSETREISASSFKSAVSEQFRCHFSAVAINNSLELTEKRKNSAFFDNIIIAYLWIRRRHERDSDSNRLVSSANGSCAAVFKKQGGGERLNTGRQQ